MTEVRVYVGPEPDPDVAAAIERGGGEVVDGAGDANAIVWLEPRRSEEVRAALHDGIAWVQVPSAGVERWLREGIVDGTRVWAGAQGAYAADVAEHAVAFVLAAARRLPQAAHRRSWEKDAGERVAGTTVGIVGAGGIGRAVIELLAPFGVRTIALTHSGRHVPEADRSVGPDGLHDLLRESEYVVLSAPLTPETRGVIGAAELELLGPGGWLVNVARGGLVDTDSLVAALAAGRLGGACLDVTDPEPLPDGHPLWAFDNVLITPHVANPPHQEMELLAARIEENVRHFARGEELVGRIDPGRGY